MRQPQYKLGQVVKVPLRVSRSEIELHTTITVEGIVAGVSFDPQCGTTGWPFYRYSVLAKGAKRTIEISEARIEMEGGGGEEEEAPQTYPTGLSIYTLAKEAVNNLAKHYRFIPEPTVDGRRPPGVSWILQEYFRKVRGGEHNDTPEG